MLRMNEAFFNKKPLAKCNGVIKDQSIRHKQVHQLDHHQV
jgi:hypothetical protein